MSRWRALTLRQPWPAAIVLHGKRVENRTWPVPVKHLMHPCPDCGISPGWTDRSVRKRNEARTLGMDRASSLLTACEKCGGRNSDDETVVQPGTGNLPFRVMIHSGLKVLDVDEILADPMLSKFMSPAAALFAQSPDRQFLADGNMPVGAVVAVVTVTGSHKSGRYVDPVDAPPDCITTGCAKGETPNPWAHKDIDGKTMHHWMLTDVIPLNEPVPAKGKQGLWEPSRDVIEAVELQLF